jgi:hypothetical protein
MRVTVFALTALLVGLTLAHASVGFSCRAEDKSATFAVSGAYGTSLGSGLINFGADVQIKLAGAPDDIRKLKLDPSHVAQAWFHYRDLKLMTRWQSPDGAPFREIILMIETHRAKAEEAPYRGRYTLTVAASPSAAGGETKRIEASGLVSCMVD